jgi:hypothetical protein
MNQLPAIFHANEGLVVAAALLLGITGVLAIVTAMMKGGRVSLRPIVFMAGLMAPLILSFVLVQLIRARQPGESTSPPTAGWVVRDGMFANRPELFGADLAPDSVRDAQAVFPQVLSAAEHAELALVGTGESVLAAQFPTAALAEQAAAGYWAMFTFTDTSGDEARGWRARRSPTGDYVEMLRAGRHLYVWTALSREACTARRNASSAAHASRVEHAASPAPLIPALQPLGAFLRQPATMMLGGALMVGLYSLWFFKGAAWASSSPAAPGVEALAAADVAARLESINALDVPFRVEPGERPGEFFATWRYADAKWIDHARAHGLRRTCRIRLVLDASARVVRATDYTAGFDWSAGADGARIAWQATLGVAFFQTEQREVFGLQLDEHGHFAPELSYAYTFTLQEMKSPLIDAVTRAGWTWRPVVWLGPTWLRWLTE